MVVSRDQELSRNKERLEKQHAHVTFSAKAENGLY